MALAGQYPGNPVPATAFDGRALLTSVGPGRRLARALAGFLSQSRPGAMGLAIVVVYAIMAALAPVVAPADPTQVFNGQQLQPPGPTFWFGTDQNGMDVFSRTVFAARIDLGIATAAEVLALAAGVLLGLLTGYRGGWIDFVALRAMDVIQAFPVLLLAIAIVAATSQSISAAIFVIAFIDVPIYTRLVRGEVLRVRETTYVMAAFGLGNPIRRLLRKHVLPNAIPPILTQIAVRYAWTIKVIAALAFVGVGIQVPTPEWGSMIRVGADSIISGYWWPSIFPGLAVVILILGLNLLADGLQDHLNPRRQRGSVTPARG